MPRSQSSVYLYSTGSKLQLSLSSLGEVYKVAKVRQAIMLRDSNAKQRGWYKDTPRKKVSSKRGSQSAEERLKQSDIFWQGLGCITKRFTSASKQSKRELAHDEVQQGEEKTLMAKAVGQKKQGSLLRWKPPWDELWKMESRGIRFAISFVYDTLPTPTNLCLWRLSEDLLCKLCGKRATL